MTKSVVLILAILLAITSYAYSGGTIRGCVRNSDTKQLLGKSQLHFYKTGKDSVSRFIETSTGNFVIVGVPLGEYSCRIYHPGYRPMLALHIEVNAGGITEVDFLLRLCKSPTDSTSLDINAGTLDSGNKIRIYTPGDKDYR